MLEKIETKTPTSDSVKLYEIQQHINRNIRQNRIFYRVHKEYNVYCTRVVWMECIGLMDSMVDNI